MSWIDFLGRRRRRRFSTWQIEITTRCPLLCKMCLKAEYRDYKRKDMTLENFRKLAGYFREVKSVVLEGWGESLLHPQLIEFVKIAKGEGCEVGFVTSGYGLDETYASELLEAGMDFIGFSFSGAKASTHEKIRVNSSFNSLLRSVKCVYEAGKRRRTPPLKVHIVYLLLKENIEESPEIIDLAYELNIKEVVFLNIVQISNLEQNGMKVFTYEGKNPYEEILLNAKKKAASRGIRLFCPSLTASEMAFCPENPLGSLYVSVDGDVSPCVYLNPPVRSPFVRIFKGEIHEVQNVIFGNLFEESIVEIWNKEHYKAFREAHARRVETYGELLQNLSGFNVTNIKSLPRAPQACETCHKIYGL